MATIAESFDQQYRIDPTTGCWEWMRGKIGDGYGCLSHSGKMVLAHRFAWERFHGRPVAAGMNLLHSCDNRACVNPEHLREGTQAQNAADMARRGRANSKVTNAQSDEIRKLYDVGLLQREIGALFGISQHQVSRICSRQSRRFA